MEKGYALNKEEMTRLLKDLNLCLNKIDEIKAFRQINGSEYMLGEEQYQEKAMLSSLETRLTLVKNKVLNAKLFTLKKSES